MTRSLEKYFRNKVVIITGASSGIGRCCALLSAGLNARVVLASRSLEKLRALQQEIQKNAGLSVAIQADVRNFEDTQKIVHETLSMWGRIDILIACAGKYVQDNTRQIDIQSFNDSMSINFYGTLNAIKSVLPEMQKKGSGHIVIVNSLDAKKGIIGDAPYVAAKAALDGFGDTLRQEMKNSHINITSIFPGRVDTPMIQNITVPRLSPKIPPVKVAKAIIKGIHKNKAIIIIPSAYTPIAVLNPIMPRLFDWVYRVLHLEGERIYD